MKLTVEEQEMVDNIKIRINCVYTIYNNTALKDPYMIATQNYMNRTPIISKERIYIKYLEQSSNGVYRKLAHKIKKLIKTTINATILITELYEPILTTLINDVEFADYYGYYVLMSDKNNQYYITNDVHPKIYIDTIKTDTHRLKQMVYRLQALAKQKLDGLRIHIDDNNTVWLVYDPVEIQPQPYHIQ